MSEIDRRICEACCDECDKMFDTKNCIIFQQVSLLIAERELNVLDGFIALSGIQDKVNYRNKLMLRFEELKNGNR